MCVHFISGFTLFALDGVVSGATENAGVENAGVEISARKVKKNAVVENTGVETSARFSRGGKCRSRGYG